MGRGGADLQSRDVHQGRVGRLARAFLLHTSVIRISLDGCCVAVDRTSSVTGIARQTDRQFRKTGEGASLMLGCVASAEERAQGRRVTIKKNTYTRNIVHLRVLRPQRLVGCRAPSPDDGHRHVELSSRSRVRVTGAAELGHAVDAEVCVHQLHDGAVPVHALAQRLGLGREGMGWDRMGWDGIGRDGMGWDGIKHGGTGQHDIIMLWDGKGRNWIGMDELGWPMDIIWWDGTGYDIMLWDKKGWDWIG